MGNHDWRPLGRSPMVTMEMGDPIFWCVFFYFYFLRWPLFHIHNGSLDICFATSERSILESCYQNRFEAALEFVHWIKDFDNLVEPRLLYNHCFGPEPSESVLRKILQEEKSTYILLLFYLPFLFISVSDPSLWFCFCRDGH